MKLTLENKINNGFILSLLILIIIAIVSYLCIIDLDDDAHRTKQSEQVMTQLSDLLFSITEAETAQRGYVITGNENFLEPFVQDESEIANLLKSLRSLTSDNQYHQERIKVIESLIEKRLSMIKSLIEMRRDGGFDLVQHEIAKGNGRMLQSEIRGKIGAMQHEEYINQIALEQNSVSSIRFTKLVISIGSLIALLFVYLALIIIRRGFVERTSKETEIKTKNEELQKLNSEKDKFFSIIAHDLRTPFNGLLGMTQLMVEGLPDMTQEEIRQIASSLRNSATNLFSLLENLLQWSQMEQGLIPFRQDEIQLISIVNESLKTLLEPARNKGIKIVCAIPENSIVYADQNMFQSIMRNLVSNALKYTNKDGNINISSRAIPGNAIEISIRDSGIGMKHEMAENLFNPKVNSRRPGTRGEPSTGLGLLLCKEFVEKQGGKLWVESEEHKGSTFYFTVPCKV